MGCHTSTNKGLGGMQCEVEGNSFVAGFVGMFFFHPREFFSMEQVFSDHPRIFSVYHIFLEF